MAQCQNADDLYRTAQTHTASNVQSDHPGAAVMGSTRGLTVARSAPCLVFLTCEHTAARGLYFEKYVGPARALVPGVGRMFQAVAASSMRCELCVLVSLILAARAGLDNCARSKSGGGFDQATTPPLRAVIELSADPTNAPNQSPMQGNGSSAVSAVTQFGSHECLGTYASPSRATSAAFGHNRCCRPGNLSFASSHGDGDHHDSGESGFVSGDCSWASWAAVVVPKWSSWCHLGTPTATVPDAHTLATIRHATVSITAADDARTTAAAAETAAVDAVEDEGEGESVTQERH